MGGGRRVEPHGEEDRRWPGSAGRRGGDGEALSGTKTGGECSRGWLVTPERSSARGGRVAGAETAATMWRCARGEEGGDRGREDGGGRSSGLGSSGRWRRDAREKEMGDGILGAASQGGGACAGAGGQPGIERQVALGRRALLARKEEAQCQEKKEGCSKRGRRMLSSLTGASASASLHFVAKEEEDRAMDRGGRGSLSTKTEDSEWSRPRLGLN